MTFTQAMSLLGGLALFLFGMKMMSDGLEQAAGNRMKKILERLTSNRLLGVAVGAAVTAVIQSSSATTVMVVGFVNSRLMTLRQAIWIIMGANIGTTITGQLIALDVGVIAPMFAAIGVVCIVFLKSKKLYHIGYVIAGLGILFIGMDTMSASMSGLKDSTVFADAVTNLSNPVVGILVGTIFTAVIQSSSASVGILQALAESGAIALSNSVYVLFGQNIGTCVTAVIASIGTSRNAKRATIIHLMFNIIGTVLFTLIAYFTPFTELIESLTPGNPERQIANIHTTFNIVTTLLLLPIGPLLEAAAKKILPERAEENDNPMMLKFIAPSSALIAHPLGSASIALSQICSELQRMYTMAIQNVGDAFNNVIGWNEELSEKIKNNEECVDFLNAEITKYISGILPGELTDRDAKTISVLFKICGDVERISDHAMNISEYGDLLHKKGYPITSEIRSEIEEMRRTAIDSLSAIDLTSTDMSDTAFAAAKLAEERNDALTETYRANEIARLRSGETSGDTSVLYSEMITDFERIGDHLLNIAELLTGVRKHTAPPSGEA